MYGVLILFHDGALSVQKRLLFFIGVLVFIACWAYGTSEGIRSHKQ